MRVFLEFVLCLVGVSTAIWGTCDLFYDPLPVVSGVSCQQHPIGTDVLYLAHLVLLLI